MLSKIYNMSCYNLLIRNEEEKEQRIKNKIRERMFEISVMYNIYIRRERGEKVERDRNGRRRRRKES